MQSGIKNRSRSKIQRLGSINLPPLFDASFFLWRRAIKSRIRISLTLQRGNSEPPTDRGRKQNSRANKAKLDKTRFDVRGLSVKSVSGDVPPPFSKEGEKIKKAQDYGLSMYCV